MKQNKRMTQLILHGYPASPFTEKVRLMLGYKGLSWHSVIMPMVLPKPELTHLTGGYRRAPVLQMGADIYCDSALIADVLEHLQPLPSLYPEPAKGMARILAQWADSTLFSTVMAYNMQPAGLADLFGKAPPELAKAFIDDRRAMSAGMPRLRPADAAAAYKSYLRRLSDMLDDLPFLLGDSPCIADFSVMHCLWFTRKRTPSLAGILNLTPAVLDWMDRMSAIGHGNMEKISPQDALGSAAEASPLPLHDDIFQDEHGIPLGSQVTVAAESLGQEATQGELVAATRMHYTLARDDARVGRVHVHFPRIGFSLRLANGPSADAANAPTAAKAGTP